MNSIEPIYETSESWSPLRDKFMGWQCRVRQIAMREAMGKPNNAIAPVAYLEHDSEPLGQIVTVICKLQAYSKTPELQHIFKHTNDPVQRRDKALQFLSETYFQKHREFSDMLAATFSLNSHIAKALQKAGKCYLDFNAYGHRFKLRCKVTKLGSSHPNYQATWWHNLLFNPKLNPYVLILGFEPDWTNSEIPKGISATAGGGRNTGDRLINSLF